MTQQTIGVGTVANDGTGDLLRTAFTKANGNFGELYGEAHPGYIVGNWYLPLNYCNIGTGGAPSVGSIRLYPAFVPKKITIDTLGARVIGNVASSNVQLAVYANNPATNKPTGTALCSTASLSTATAGNVSGAVTSVQIGPGIYWFAGNVDTAALTFTEQSGSVQGIQSMLMGSTALGSIMGGSSAGLAGFGVTQTFGTWPDLTSATFTEILGASTTIGVAFHVASVP